MQFSFEINNEINMLFKDIYVDDESKTSKNSMCFVVVFFTLN